MGITIPTVERVTSVYSGKAGRCCCGCSGNHRYASRVKDQGVALRGYALAPEEINDRQIKRVLGILAANTANPSLEQNETYTSVEVDGRLYIAYTREPKA